METLTKTKDDIQLYPEILYFAKRVSVSGGQKVFKKLLPNGEVTEFSPNLSWKLRNHCPDGFQWGYGGAGPAQLSLALLLDATSDPDTALHYYQQFKWDKVACWGDEWSITRGSILHWLQEEQSLQLQRGLSPN